MPSDRGVGGRERTSEGGSEDERESGDMEAGLVAAVELWPFPFGFGFFLSWGATPFFEALDFSTLV